MSRRSCAGSSRTFARAATRRLSSLRNKFDKTSLTAATLRLPQSEIDVAEAQCGKDALAALDVAAKRIESYHTAADA